MSKLGTAMINNDLSWLRNRKTKSLPSRNVYRSANNKLIKSYERLLVENIKISPSIAAKIVKQCDLTKIPESNVVESLQICKELHFKKENITGITDLLKISPFVLKQRTYLIQEIGSSIIPASLVARFLITMRLSESYFKAYTNMSPDANIAQNLLSYVEKPPPNIPPLEISDKNLTIHDYHIKCLQYYLSWRLKLNPNQVEHIWSAYPRLKYKSFRLIKEVIRTLEDDIGFNLSKIRANMHLLYSDPENIQIMARELKTVAGIDLKSLARKNPVMLRMTVKNIQKNLDYLKENNIPDTAIQKLPRIVGFNVKTLEKRMNDMEGIPELQVLRNHPRFLYLLNGHVKATQRLAYLHEMKMKHASLNILSASRKQFEKFATSGSGKYPGKDLIEILHVELNRNKKEIREKLHRHPFWQYVPLVQVRDTLTLLRHKGYSTEDLWQYLYIILYSSSKVAAELDAVERKYPDERYPHYTRRQRMALCVYFIEKVNHFTGDGVWKSQDEKFEIFSGIRKIFEENKFENK